MSLAIKVENLSKAYRLGEIGTGTISRDLERWYAKVRGKEDPFLKIGEVNDRTVKGSSDVVWSLKDINFQIKEGEAVGVIGKNGAGKSTLLKLLSRITSPTTGEINVKGRIASLLEVGTGFHPELTGKENIYLNGAILGMRKKEIQRKFEEIVDFAGVERYVDTPVKRYSSGMYVRLAFAVAAYLESEILIVDEVLAVGDLEFQKKCLGKMNEVSKGQGRTVLFVSHNMDSILRLCSKTILLSNGNVRSVGNTEQVISSYLNDKSNITNFKEYQDINTAPGNDLVRLLSVEVLDQHKNSKVNLLINEMVGISIRFKVLKTTSDLVLGFNLYTQTGTHILSSHDVDSQKAAYEAGEYQRFVWLPPNFLAEGVHYCGIAAMSYSPFSVHFHDVNQFFFNVTDMQSGETVRGDYTGEFPGVIRPKLSWTNN